MELLTRREITFIQGRRITDVFDLAGQDDSGITCGMILRTAQKVRLLCCPLRDSRVTIYDGVIVKDDGIPLIAFDEKSQICPKRQNETGPLSKFVELFAGFGGMGLAARFLGGSVDVAVDWNDVSIQQLQRHDIGTVLKLDLADPSASKKIHMHTKDSTPVALMGFPCQPHSLQGAQQGFRDARAGLLWDGLRCIFLLQCQAAVLECVAPAGRDPEVLQALRALCDLMDWQMLTVEIDLKSQWPNCRKRWWAMLFPRGWEGHLQPWTQANEDQQVKDIMPTWQVWPKNEEDLLALSLDELMAYQNKDYGHDPRLIDREGKVGTILHSYGNPLSGCPCGCRMAGFATTSLRKKGLRGCYLSSSYDGRARYMHPKEAALLLGVRKDTPMGDDLKASLCLLGLIASPLQGVWVIAHLICSYDRAHGIMPTFTPQQALLCYKNHLKSESSTQWKSVLLQRFEIEETDGKIEILQASTDSHHDSLQMAESKLLNWGELLKSKAEDTDPNLADSWILRRENKKQKCNQPTDEIVLYIYGGRKSMATIEKPGIFAFELLRKFDLDPTSRVLTSDGKLHQPDFRLWHTQKICLVAHSEFPTVQMSLPMIGAGRVKREPTGDAHFAAAGLTDVLVFQEACKIARNAGWPDNYIWSPRLVLRIQETMWTAMSSAWIQEQKNKSQDAYGIMWDQGHWVTFHVQWKDNVINCLFLDGLRELISTDMLFFLAIATESEIGEVTLDYHIKQTHGVHCGAIALLHLKLMAGFQGPYTEELAEQWHVELIDDVGYMATHGLLEGNVECSPTWKWTLTGLGTTQEQELAKLLCEKGVPVDRSVQRAKDVIAKVGRAMVGHALRSDTPWPILKTAANAPGTRMRLIQPDEQQQYIEQRAQNKSGADIIKKKRKKHIKEGSDETLTLDPQLLTISAEHFQDEKGVETPVIKFDEIAAGKRGIALANCAMAKHFIDNAKQISKDALAVLLVDLPPQDILDASKITPMRFPAMYLGTREHTLIFGGILNIGDTAVQRKSSVEGPKMNTITTAVIKITIHREQLQLPWTDLVKSPVKSVLVLVPALLLCEGKNCGKECSKTHQVLGESFDTILLQVWSRNFASSKGGATNPNQADQFSVFARVPEAVLDAVVSCTVPGVYIEPRKEGERGHHPAYRVIWLPKASHDDALHQCRTCPFALGLVRIKDRYGLRVLQPLR